MGASRQNRHWSRLWPHVFVLFRECISLLSLPLAVGPHPESQLPSKSCLAMCVYRHAARLRTPVETFARQGRHFIGSVGVISRALASTEEPSRRRFVVLSMCHRQPLDPQSEKWDDGGFVKARSWNNTQSVTVPTFSHDSDLRQPIAPT